jgi:hypothetical protein
MGSFPPINRPATEERREGMNQTVAEFSPARLCQHCQTPLRADARPQALYCSDACRKDASRARKTVASEDPEDDDAFEPPHRRRGHIIAAGGVFAVGVALTALSLDHLASGIQIVTGCGARDGWLLASGIDLGFLAEEGAMLAASASVRPAVTKYAQPAIGATLTVSAALNAFAFASHAPAGVMMYFAAALGCMIPCLIYTLAKTGAALFLEDKQ